MIFVLKAYDKNWEHLATYFCESKEELEEKRGYFEESDILVVEEYDMEKDWNKLESLGFNEKLA